MFGAGSQVAGEGPARLLVSRCCHQFFCEGVAYSLRGDLCWECGVTGVCDAG